MAIQAQLPGGGFLLGESDPQGVHTPEDFTDEHHLLANTIRDFVAQEVVPLTEAIEAKEEGVIPTLLKKAGELGLLSTEVPQKFGGAGMGLTYGMLLMESASLGGGSFLTSLADHIGIGTLPIVYSGSDELRHRYLPQLASGELLGCYCLTEPQSGSDALAAQTSAELSADGTHYLLNGAKHYITNAAFSDLYTVFAKVDKTLFTAFVVERDAAGLTIGKEEHKMGIVGSSTCPVYLENTPVPVENVLGEVGAGHRVAFNILNVGRLKLGAGCLGGIKSAIAEAVPYAKERQQFNRPIASFGLIQQKIADMAIQAYVLESVIYRTTGLIEDRLETLDPAAEDYDELVIKAIEEYAVECSVAKVAGSEMLDFVVDEMVQIYGGLGFIEESPAPRAYRDARINRIFEGTNEINRLLIPDTLMRRAMRGQLPLMDAVQQVTQNLLAPLQPLFDSDDDPLHVERQLLERCKQAALLAAGVAVQRYQQELQEQQEILGMIADMAIEIFTAECALLRTVKCRAVDDGDPQDFRLDITRAWCRALPEKIERLAASTLAASVEGDSLTTPLAAVKKLTRVTPANTVAIKRRVAAIMIETGRYPL